MNEIVEVKETQVAAWKNTLDRAMPQIGEALPAHITQKKFRQVAANAIVSTPALMRCMNSNPKAVLTALMECAADGLLPNNREAALVPYKDTLTYIPMIAGVLKRMRQSGDVKSVRSRIVCENDKFEITFGDDETFTHFPALTDRGSPVGAYAIIELADGERYREWMDKDQILAVKKAAKSQKGPWAGPFELEMWRKTVLKRAAKYCPMSEDIQEVLDRDNSFYDPDKVIEHEPATARAKFKSLADAPAERRKYDDAADELPAESDEVPPRDDTPPEPHTEADESGSSPQDPTEGLKLFMEGMGKIKKAKSRDAAAKAFEATMKDPRACNLSDQQREELTEELFNKE